MTTISLKPNRLLTLTTDAFSSGHVVELGADNKPVAGTFTAVSTSATVTVGPNASQKNYRIQEDFGSITQTETDSTPASASVAAGTVDVEDLASGTDGNLITWDASGDPAVVATGTSGQVLTSGGAGVAPTMETLAIAVSEVADGTDGELITWGTDGTAETVAVGTATHVLTSNGAGAAPTFQAAASGNLVYLGTDSASNDASLTIGNTYFSTSYTAILIRCRDLDLATDTATLRVHFSDDDGSTFETAGWEGVGSRQVDDTATAYSPSGTDYIEMGGSGIDNTRTNGEHSLEMLFIPKSAAMNSGATGVDVYYRFKYTDSTADRVGYDVGAGNWYGAHEIDAIKFQASTGNLTQGRFEIFGYTNT